MVHSSSKPLLAATPEVVLGLRRRALYVKAVQLGLLAAVLLGSFYFCGLLQWQTLANGVPAIYELTLEALPPDFSEWRLWWRPLLDTVAMSIAGTALAVSLSLVLGFLAARNTTPHPTVYWFARGLLNVLRALPELILGIVFVAAVGFGMLPGVLALGLHSIGMVGKFFAESIEHVDDAPIEAVRASGGRPLQVLLHGVLPQVLPQMADVSVYRWEFNFRASMVVGIVGAGGIGMELFSRLRIFEYQQVTALLIVILGMVVLVDTLGSQLRMRFK